MTHFFTSPLITLFMVRAFARLRALAVFIILCLGISLPAMADPGRLALVVGNQAYQHVPRLANPGNDARGVADALRRLGFEVTLLTDVNTEVFNVVVKAFAEQAKSADAVVFYYSGHAFQLDGQNHLLPVSAQPDAAGSVEGQTWKLDDIVSELQAPKAQTLIFLDACRTSPIEGRAGVRDGLAQMQTRAGTFISFATRPGAVSFDRDGARGNSPYTTALLNHMEKPGLSISDLMIKVRNDVETATDGQQTPWDQSSLRAQFFFNPAAANPGLPVFETVQSDTTISPPPGGTGIEEQIASLEPPKPGPVIQRIEAQDQSAVVAGAPTRAVPLSPQPAQQTAAPVIATPVPVVAAEAAPKPTAQVVAALPEPVTPSAAVEAAPKPAAPVVAAVPNPVPPAPSTLPAFAAAVPTAKVLPETQPVIPEDLNSAIQSELKRVGCYSLRVDGDWGNGSRRALSTYFESSETEAESLEPTPDLYLALLKEPEGVCPPAVVQSAPKAAPKKVIKRGKPTPQKAAAPAKKAPAKKAQAKKTPYAAEAPKKKGTTCTFLIVAIVCK